MPDHHYHANHVDAPARGSKAAAMKDARRLRLHNRTDELAERVPGNIKTAENIKQHGVEFPLIVRCFRPECEIRKAD